jgi:hypothetical protein
MSRPLRHEPGRRAMSPRVLGSRRNGPVQSRLILVASDINPVVHADQRHNTGNLHVRAAAGYAADGHEERGRFS